MTPFLRAALLSSLLALPAAAPAFAADLAITDVFSRATTGSGPGSAPGVAYLTIRGGDVADRLLGASSPAAAKVELHSMTMQGSTMRMREIDAVDIPAGATVALAPGAPLHLMLVGLTAPLRPGARVPLVLRFEKAGERQVEAVVGTPGQAAMPNAPGPATAGHAH